MANQSKVETPQVSHVETVDRSQKKINLCPVDVIGDVRFFQNRDSLCAVHGYVSERDIPSEKFIIAKDYYIEETKRVVKNFALVDSIDKVKFVIDKMKECRGFANAYEVIPGWFWQKLKLDVDYKNNSAFPNELAFTTRILNRSLQVLSTQFGITDPKYMIKTSHDQNKHSYHIIFPYMVKSNDHAKYFYDQVYSGLSAEEIAYSADHGHILDAQVYGLWQNFRYIGCAKIPTPDRVFIYAESSSTWKPEDPFAGSLITNSIGTQRIEFALPEDYQPYVHTSIRSERETLPVLINRDDIVITNPDLISQFDIRPTKNGVIPLRRINSGVCPCCPYTKTEPHDSDGAFLVLSNSGLLSYYCRRALAHNVTRNYKVGYLVGSAITVSDLLPEIEESNLEKVKLRVAQALNECMKFVNDEKLSNLLYEVLKDDLLFITIKGKEPIFYHWNDNTKLWDEISNPQFYSIVSGLLLPSNPLGAVLKETSISLLNSLNDLDAETDKKRILQIKAELKTIGQLEYALGDNIKVDKCLKRLSGRLYKPGMVDRMDGEKYLIPLNDDKVFDLRTGLVSPRLRSHFFTKKINAVYNPAANSAALRDFFNKISLGQPDWLNSLQDILGSSLILGNFLQKFYIFTGGGANGKSTILLLMSATLGLLCNIADPSVFIEQKKTGGPNPELVYLRGARCVMCEEVSGKNTLSADEIKRTTGSSPITTRGLYQGCITFIPKWLPIMLFNDPPKLPDGDSYGFYRRFIMLFFGCKFVEPHEEKGAPNEFPKIADFNQTIVEDQEALSFFLNWLIVGAMRVIQNKNITLSEPIKVYNQNFRAGQDPNGFVSFFNEAIKKTDNKTDFLAVTDLYKMYEAHCSAQDLKPVPSATFSRRKTHNITPAEQKKVEGKNKMCHIGWTISPDFKPIFDKYMRENSGPTPYLEQVNVQVTARQNVPPNVPLIPL